MNPQTIMRRLWAVGVRLELASDGRLFAKPSDRLTDELRGLCREHKAELIDFLYQAEATAHAVIEASMRACDAWQDTEQARAQMRRDCLEIPPHLRADLLAHFDDQYPRKDTQ